MDSTLNTLHATLYTFHSTHHPLTREPKMMTTKNPEPHPQAQPHTQEPNMPPKPLKRYAPAHRTQYPPTVRGTPTDALAPPTQFLGTLIGATNPIV
jgi:hypothetical protein